MQGGSTIMVVAVLERPVDSKKEVMQKPNNNQKGFTPSTLIRLTAILRCKRTRSTAFARKNDPMNTKCVSLM
jgi:hypothetical protein